jgi:hypothetical protein
MRIVPTSPHWGSERIHRHFRPLWLYDDALVPIAKDASTYVVQFVLRTPCI